MYKAGCDAIQHLQVGGRAIMNFVDFVERLWMGGERWRAEEEATRGGHGGVFAPELSKRVLE